MAIKQLARKVSSLSLLLVLLILPISGCSELACLLGPGHSPQADWDLLDAIRDREDCPTGALVRFDASYTFDQENDIQSYRWDFGDGTQGVGIAPTHYYPNWCVTYTVVLTVTDKCGNVSKKARRI